jgi:diguanylate cyclase (GGDEF)-like protein/PAS domain S-box-containing protein
MTALSAMQNRSDAAPRWIDRLFYALVGYVALVVTWMLAGFGGERVIHFVGLLADSPASLMALTICFAISRRLEPGPLRSAWSCLSASIACYFAGTIIGVWSWLHERDPFPGIADVFYIAYYPMFYAGLWFLVRASAARIPWARLALDAAILGVGFGAFFWYLVTRSEGPSTELGVIKNALSQTYLLLNCTGLLSLGVVLMTCIGSPGGRRIPLLLLVGFSMMFLGDIVWAVTKVTGNYLPGNMQDVLYTSFYIPLVAAARTQLRLRTESPAVNSNGSDTLVQALPYAAMLTAFLVLVNFTRGDIHNPGTILTIVVFALTLLLMLRQSLVLRDEAATRERRAARMVEDRYASLIANASDVIMIVASNGVLAFASPACERTLGLKPEELTGRNLLDLWTGDDGERLRGFLGDVAASHGAPVGPVELRIDRDKVRYVLELVGTNLNDDPAVRGLALNFRDISERKALEEQLRELAFHDPLTLLANRNLFRDRVQHALSLAQRGEHRVAVMFLDLDNFKNINDSLGHDAGDTLLQAVASRLVATTRACDTVARLGGDEFAVLLEGFTALSDIERVADSLIDAMDQPFALSATVVHVPASIGIAYGSEGVEVDALLSRADIAMYYAKAAGKNRHTAFKPEMQESLHERLRLEADIGRAFANEEFFLEYQPIVDLGTGSILGVEALVRWRHPELGILMPAKFIQLAEECGHIVKLGRWVLAKGCRELCAWRKSIAGGSGLRLAVNISGRHLQHGDLVQDVSHVLNESGLEPGNLVVELTESTLIQNTDANLERLRELKKLGVKLAIDDFGTGYSSLSYLHRLPIDILKIDRSFVARLTNSNNGPELARTVITLGETLGLDTVAEGIESEAQVAALLDLGCVSGQGFLFAAAGSLASLTASPFVVRRNSLWLGQTAAVKLSASGRYPALKSVS